MTGRREDLIRKTLQNPADEQEALFLDATVKMILSDLAGQYRRFHAAEGPGVLCFQPENEERSLLYMTLGELTAAMEDAERNNNDDLGESFRRIIKAAEKIHPDEKAGYVINDNKGMRYIELDLEASVNGS
jgi:hypothetical protein